MEVKDGSFVVTNWKQARILEDTLVAQQSFEDQYTTLYNIAYHPHTLWAIIMITTPQNISFRMFLVDDKLRETTCSEYHKHLFQ